MICFCKKYFKIGFYSFNKNQQYIYSTEKHKETKLKIYFVYIDNGDSIPFTEEKFKERFDDREEIRNEKINQILS